MNKLPAILIFPLCLLTVNHSFAQEVPVPPKPNPPTLVNDFAHVMTPDQVAALEQKLVHYDDSTSNQIVIVTEPTIGDAAIEEYSYKLFNNWGIGNKKSNNGVLILVAIDKHQIFITVGTGLQGAIPDVTAKSIIDNEITPNFRAGGNDNYYRGFDQSADALVKAAAGEYKAPAGYRQRGRHSGGGGGLGFLVIIFIVIVIIISRKGGGGRGGGGGYYGGGGFLPFLLGTMVGRGLGGGGGGGGGWGGGGGGEGFGGFGGGSSDGGGAGGSW